MTRVIVATLAVLALAVVGLAEARADDRAAGVTGARQLVFSIDMWDLGSYNGGIGLRYFLRDDLALRPSLSLGVEKHSRDYATTWDDNDAFTFGLTIMGEKYTGAFHNVFPFVAAGLGYRYTSSETDEGRRPSNGDNGWTYTWNDVNHSLDVVAGVGFQWRFTEAVSLGGQYNIGYSHSWGRQSETSVYEHDVEQSEGRPRSTSISIYAGRLLVSVLF